MSWRWYLGKTWQRWLRYAHFAPMFNSRAGKNGFGGLADWKSNIALLEVRQADCYKVSWQSFLLS